MRSNSLSGLLDRKFKTYTSSEGKLYECTALVFNYHGKTSAIMFVSDDDSIEQAMKDNVEDWIDKDKSSEYKVLERLKKFLTLEREKNGKRNRRKVGHIPYMCVDTTRTRNRKIRQKKRDEANSQRAERIPPRPFYGFPKGDIDPITGCTIY